MFINQREQLFAQWHKTIIVYSFFAVSMLSLQLHATNYYIDNLNGNDSNPGLSVDKAWKSLAKVNAKTFLPGDSILFKSGGLWVGRLYPGGSGSSGNPIVIDKYGGVERPLFDGNGMTGTGVVYLYNQAYWEINNLEVTNDATAEGDRRGVRIEINEGIGVVNHIYLRNLHIHHIKGRVGHDRSHKRTAGIGFAVVSANSGEARFNDIRVENCLIHDCVNQGIITECVGGDGYQPGTPEWNRMRITNAAIRNNTIYNISKNAMIIRLFDGGIVEYNVCYNTANGISGNTMFTCACNGTVFQYNEGYLNNSPDADGSMYDADLRSPNTVWQYSYSHDNAHGLFWNCTVQEDANIICRYNISQNDKGILFCINYPVNSIHIYNNTVYIPSHLSPVIISERNNGNKTGEPNTRTYNFRNNIIYNLSSTATYDWRNIRYNRTFEANCFYGMHPAGEPADLKKITSNPMLVNPGSGEVGINSVNGYQLQSNSPCIDAGVVIDNNGGRDYWGNSLSDEKTDIGANEFPKVSSIEKNVSEAFTIRLFPNPILLGSTLSFLTNGGISDLINVSVYTQDGKEIFRKNFTCLNEKQVIEVPFTTSGLYVFEFRDQNNIFLQKIVVK
jgi:hypothetical protein